VRSVPGTRRGLIAALILALALGAAAGAGPAAAADAARAHGVGALLGDGNHAAATAVSGSVERRRATEGGLRDGLGEVGRVVVTLEASGTPGVAEGRVEARDLVLLDGRVVAARLAMAVRVRADGGAELTEAVAEGLLVDGVPQQPGPGARIEIAGVGAVVLFEQVGDGTDAIRANALRIELAEPGAGTPTSVALVIGHLDAAAVADAAPEPGDGADEPPAPAPEPAQTPYPAPTPSPAPQAGPGVASAPAPAPTPSPLPVAPQLVPQPEPPTSSATAGITPTSDGYVFPALGDVSFTDDYGAPRAGTGWHHGNDLFADTGTPLLAVTDGTLGRVGVNTLGGNRLWLTDAAGNQFYYAHLSAYAPGTVNGARVRAGQVIGFMGNTGQAITTPPHLHFEIHPRGGDSVNPYPYLIAWQRGAPVARAFRAAEVVRGSAPAPATGAVLVGVDPAGDEDAPTEGDGLAVPVR
jgi:murein DD-endopeptidase MepM/ murein hydrolase activator NlpD